MVRWRCIFVRPKALVDAFVRNSKEAVKTSTSEDFEETPTSVWTLCSFLSDEQPAENDKLSLLFTCFFSHSASCTLRPSLTTGSCSDLNQTSNSEVFEFSVPRRSTQTLAWSLWGFWETRKKAISEFEAVSVPPLGRSETVFRREIQSSLSLRSSFGKNEKPFTGKLVEILLQSKMGDLREKWWGVGTKLGL